MTAADYARMQTTARTVRKCAKLPTLAFAGHPATKPTARMGCTASQVARSYLRSTAVSGVDVRPFARLSTTVAASLDSVHGQGIRKLARSMDEAHGRRQRASAQAAAYVSGSAQTAKRINALSAKAVAPRLATIPPLSGRLTSAAAAIESISALTTILTPDLQRRVEVLARAANRPDVRTLTRLASTINPDLSRSLRAAVITDREIGRVLGGLDTAEVGRLASSFRAADYLSRDRMPSVAGVPAVELNAWDLEEEARAWLDWSLPALSLDTLKVVNLGFIATFWNVVLALAILGHRVPQELVIAVSAVSGDLAVALAVAELYEKRHRP